ncbi:MAG: peptide chain release factor N(5)-glutamine methyltransferase [Candidatus Rifleibacteriota bacterium]
MATLKKILNEARKQLADAGIDDAAMNADLMAALLLQSDRGRLPLLWNEPCDPAFIEKLMAMVQRRCQHEPLQYILGSWSFLDFVVKTGPGALIPRPETEELFVDLADSIEKFISNENFSFADICTGTGVLGIALARRFSKSHGWLSDISAEALTLAKSNLDLLEQGQKRVSLLQADLLSSFSSTALEVIVANPPYICSGDMTGLQPEVRDFEPALALDGGSDGLDLIRIMLEQACFCLKNGGLLAFEHGHGQRKMIMSFLPPAFELVKAADDLCGRERYFILRAVK